MTTARSDRRRAFFYAEASAGVYDVSIESVVPHYQALHETLFKLLTSHVRERWSPDTRKFGGAILDIGSGTGAESLRVLEALPQAHVVAVDFCAPMHRILKQKLREKGYLDRSTFVLADVVGQACTANRLLGKLPRRERTGYHAVVSAFTLHHLSHEQKALISGRIFDLLRPGGIFLNADLFSFQSQRLAGQALDFDLSWMQEHLGEGATTTGLTPTQQRRLLRQWQTHYRQYNRLEPIEDPPPSEKMGRRGQARMLLDAGFSTVAVPYRFWQTGILVAVK